MKGSPTKPGAFSHVDAILPHLMEPEHSTSAETDQQHAQAVLDARSLTHVRGVVEDLLGMLQRTEAGDGAMLSGLEYYADQRYVEERAQSQR